MTMEKRAEILGRSVAARLFAQMLNPKYRGPSFTWDGFPQMCQGLARSQAWQANRVSVHDRNAAKLEEAAARGAEAAAQEFLEESQVAMWMKLGKEPEAKEPM